MNKNKKSNIEHDVWRAKHGDREGLWKTSKLFKDHGVQRLNGDESEC
ncbi:hypothetical protein [Paenibacillus solani]|nr:hypothetical protein [Paenibacillus solani]